MDRKKISSALLILASGSVCCADEPLVVLEPSRGVGERVAHIYYNLASGERVVTLESAEPTTSRVNSASQSVWSSQVTNQCSDAGFTSEYFYAVNIGLSDEPTCSGTSCVGGLTLLDYGDISTDTVIDCVRINWVAEHDDVDLDGNGVGDGVEGLVGQWTWWDLDNGRVIDVCNRVPLIQFTIFDLPGNLNEENDFASYSMDVDLDSFSSDQSLVFEIGDTDGDPQGAAFHNAFIGVGDRNFDGLPDSDLDGDGLFDWAWTVYFYQPGDDSDWDGIPDGEFADSYHSIGVNFGAPEGDAVRHDDGSWEWAFDSTLYDAGTGQEDRFALYSRPTSIDDVDLSYHGGFWFGGFSCDDNGFGQYTPSAMFEHQLFGPVESIGECGDYNGDQTLNFFDIAAFLSYFQSQDPRVDLNGDGTHDYFDVSLFLAQFSTGCP